MTEPKPQGVTSRRRGMPNLPRRLPLKFPFGLLTIVDLVGGKRLPRVEKVEAGRMGEVKGVLRPSVGDTQH